MKKVALRIFLCIFVASVLGRTVERTASWAAQHANNDFGHSGPNRTGARMAEGRKHSPWQVHTKLLEDGSMAVSFEKSPDPPLAERTVHHGMIFALPDQGGLTLSSRAPPVLL
jgi:hypothetical protein